MNKLISILSQLLLFTLIWCILNENFDISTIITGVFVTFLSNWIIRRVLTNAPTHEKYRLSLPRFIFYLIFLLIQIYISAFDTIKRILQNQVRPQFIKLPTWIKRHWLQSIIGNSITLTPGTVTIDSEEHTYTILAIGDGSGSVRTFEKKLVKEDRHA